MEGTCLSFFNIFLRLFNLPDSLNICPSKRINKSLSTIKSLNFFPEIVKWVRSTASPCSLLPPQKRRRRRTIESGGRGTWHGQGTGGLLGSHCVTVVLSSSIATYSYRKKYHGEEKKLSFRPCRRLRFSRPPCSLAHARMLSTAKKFVS